VLERLGIDFASTTRPKGLFQAAGAASDSPASSATGDGQAFSMVWLPDAQPKWGKRFQIASLRTARWKLIRNLTRDEYEFYDIAADPHEKLDVSAQHAAEFEPLRAELDAWIAKQKVHANDLPRTAASNEHTARLRALGYL
jgi:arylsulfatase A-like enzyme